MEQFVSIAETKYSVGKGIQQDVLKAQVELSKIMDDLIKRLTAKLACQNRVGHESSLSSGAGTDDTADQRAVRSARRRPRTRRQSAPAQRPTAHEIT